MRRRGSRHALGEEELVDDDPEDGIEGEPREIGRGGGKSPSGEPYDQQQQRSSAGNPDQGPGRRGPVPLGPGREAMMGHSSEAAACSSGPGKPRLTRQRIPVPSALRSTPPFGTFHSRRVLRGRLDLL